MNWSLNVPPLFRYMEGEYVEKFFDTGELRISSFKRFAEHQDDDRCDPNEGRNVLSVRGANGVVMAASVFGDSSYVLCTSMSHDESMKKRLGNDQFKIVNSAGFGQAIAECINGFLNGIEGPCHYVEWHSLRREVDLIPECLFEQSEVAKLHLQNYLYSLFANDVYFSKRLKYRDQNEYRFIWNVHHAVDGYLDIVCPDARKYCEIRRCI